MSNPVLELRNVTAGYTSRSLGIFGRKTTRRVLDGIDLTIKQGGIFGLVGGSGSGKTTLARAVLGFIEYGGEIFIDGRERSSGSRRDFARAVQSVFQDPASSMDPTKRVGFLLEEPLVIHRLGTKAERLRRVDEVLDFIGFDPAYKKRGISELSGGQRQRVAIGIALMLEPKLIVADEPVSSLDVSVAAQILNVLRDLRERLGLSLLFISHNLELVHYLCDEVAVLAEGKLAADG
ncbi:MAG: dipeptide/oligopeptide/nickel ABC transporter ATP-binding protein [Oscillospiraceae bacterium]|jgi:ABC-type glutathione transport system ATPase component|nr:dipeptide/oligopeptide/nickel ABC transporter ATP-binding protein [Oscillospiraceae bacterium]